MQVSEISLRDFRNYETLNIANLGRFNIIFGDNGQGKTNILEALYLCAAGRSHRTSKDSDLVRIGNKSYYVKIGLKKEDGDYAIEIKYENDLKKKIRINEIPVNKLGNLMGCLNAVIFSPEDLKIVKEGPSERRRFLDILISQLKPSYFYDLQQYVKILDQRNNLLKEIPYKPALADTLDIWDSNLVKVGSRIMKIRNEFLNKLREKAENNHRTLSDSKEILGMEYKPSIDCDPSKNISELEENFNKTLSKNKKQEAIKQTTLCGPQRDDYEILLNGTSIRLFGSQGQQRTAVLAMKLSEIDLMKDETGEYPILLLDDVMSELDPGRQEYLFSNLKEIQTFITCTDTTFFKDWSPHGTVYYRVENGSIS